MARRLVAALVLATLFAASAGTYAARAGRSCLRCGHGGCCATGSRAACSIKASCCDPDPDGRVALDPVGKPGLVPHAGPVLPPVLARGDGISREESPLDVPRAPLDPPPRLAGSAV